MDSEEMGNWLRGVVHSFVGAFHSAKESSGDRQEGHGFFYPITVT